AALLKAVKRLSDRVPAERPALPSDGNGRQQPISMGCRRLRTNGRKESQYCRLGKVVTNLRTLQLHTRMILQSRLRIVIVASGTQLLTAGSGHGGNRAEHKHERMYSARIGTSCRSTIKRY